MTVKATSTVDGVTAASATINLQDGTVTIASNASAAYNAANQSITLTATVTTFSRAAVNTGGVAFTVLQGATIIGSPVTGAVANGLASASFTLPGGTPAGSYTIKAAYKGIGYTVSADSTHTLMVTP